MIKFVRILFISIIHIVFFQNAMAQDPHFSVFYGVPIGLNPAFTGNFNGNFRIGAQYRDQWSAIGSNDGGVAGYKTGLMSFEARTNRGIDENDLVGFGGLFMYDVAGSSRLRNTKYAISGSYRKALDEYGDHFIAIGGQLGMIQKTIDLSGLKWPSQWDGTRYNPSSNSGENLAGLDNNISFYDMSAGLMWGYNVYDTRHRVFAGLALMHINEPNQSFYTNNQAFDATLPMKINFNIGAGIQLSERIDVMPKFLYMKQGQNMESIFGSDVRFVFDPDDPMGNSFYVGLLGRMVGGDPELPNSSGINFESLIATARVDYNNLEIGAAYDFGVSQLKNYISYQGGFEVYLNYTFKIESNSQRKMFCPKF